MRENFEDFNIILEDEKWENIIDLMNAMKDYDGKKIAKNFHIPNGLYQLLDEDLRMIKNEEERYYAMMLFMIASIMEGANYGYNAKNGTYYKKRNNKNLHNYYKQKKEEIGV